MGQKYSTKASKTPKDKKITMVTQWTHPLTVDLNYNLGLPVLPYTLWMKMISYIVLIMS